MRLARRSLALRATRISQGLGRVLAPTEGSRLERAPEISLACLGKWRRGVQRDDLARPVDHHMLTGRVGLGHGRRPGVALPEPPGPNHSRQTSRSVSDDGITTSSPYFSRTYWWICFSRLAMLILEPCKQTARTA
jgi:hypothetical protein